MNKYNRMGGVDVMDWLLGSYLPTIREKKRYWPLILKALSVTVVAASRLLYEVNQQPLPHLEFRCEIMISR